MKELISFVIPVYNEEKYIYTNMIHLISELSVNNIHYEILLVDDGSKDLTWNELNRLCLTNSNIQAIRLSRNFGKESALCAGLDLVNGDACIIMDSDLQHPPSLILDMISFWKNDAYEVVEGVKASRGKETFVNKVGAKFFYKILQKFSGLDLNKASDFKLLDRKVIECLRQMKEYSTFFRGMSEWVGFKRKKIPFHVAQRSGGVTKWSFLRLSKLAIDAIISFSALPLHLVTLLGIILFVISIVFGIDTLYMKFSGKALTGFTTVILLLLIIGSTLMISLGIIGSYIAKIFDEVKNRPRYFITEKTNTRNH